MWMEENIDFKIYVKYFLSLGSTTDTKIIKK